MINSNNSMVQAKNVFQMDLDFTDEKYIIKVSAYNNIFYNDSSDLINSYGSFLDDFRRYNNIKEIKSSVLDFINDSVSNNHYLCDSIQTLDFTVIDDHILFKEDGDDLDFINKGEFYLGNYKFNICGSYMFIEDLSTHDKYLYYGD